MGFVRHEAKRRGAAKSADDVLVTQTRSGRKGKGSKKYMVIRISEPVMRSLGWKAAERAWISFGEGRDDGFIQIEKCTNGDSSGSYSLSAAGKGREGHGKVVSTAIRLSATQAQMNMVFPAHVVAVRPAFEVGDDVLLLNCREPRRV